MEARLLLFTIFAILIMSVSTVSCDSEQGEVAILDIRDTVRNCQLPYTVSFHTEIEAARSDVEFYWEFGDGHASSAPSPVHVYENAGTYEIILTVKERDATDSRSYFLDLSTTSLPIAPDFDIYTPSGFYYRNSPVLFVNFSQHATSYLWEFLPEQTSTATDTWFTFSSQGTFPVTLNAICNEDTVPATKEIVVAPPPDDLWLKRLTVNMPDAEIGRSLYVEISWDIFSEITTTTLENVSEFPVEWYPNDEIFFYSPADNDQLKFEVFDAVTGEVVYAFSTSGDWLRQNSYPAVVAWDEGNGFGAEAELDYP